MADYIVTSGELTSVANAIREKNGTNSSLSWPNGFVSGIGSGGGGSSDFSTATLTLIAPNGVKPTEPFPLGLVMPMISDDGIYSSTDQNSEFIIDEAENLFTIVLYKGKAYATVTITEEFMRLSGGISKVDDETYLITGDCSIELLNA